jgi:predicted RNA-binding protein with PUA-like domain
MILYLFAALVYTGETMRYWLLKTEPSCYSIDDLKRDKKTAWTDVRNYQARNMMRDLMSPGDPCVIYHSSAGDETGVAGFGTVASASYPDPTQFDPKHDGYDPKASAEKPIWMLVDITFAKKLPEVLKLSDIRRDKSFGGLELLRRGSRLSVQPVSKEHFEALIAKTSK